MTGRDSQKETQIFTPTYSFKKRCGTHKLGLKAKEDVQGIKGKLVTSSQVRGKGACGLALCCRL